jgi:hypothetical protein
VPPRIFKPKKKRDRGAEALARLKNRWNLENEEGEWGAEAEPVITPMLKSIGIPIIIDALRMHDEDDARAFIAIWDQSNQTDRHLLRIEDIAFASGIGSLRLGEISQTALYLYASMQTKMLISTAMPKVTKAIIKAATDEVPIVADTVAGRIVVGKTNGDVKAMELFGRISGIAPVPKGATIAIQNNYGAEKEDRPDTTWKEAEERLREFHDLTEPKRLPSPEAKPILIGGHIDSMQAETVEILRGE